MLNRLLLNITRSKKTYASGQVSFNMAPITTLVNLGTVFDILNLYVC